MKFALLLLAAVVTVYAKPKEILGASHGDSMSVSYRQLESGKYALVVLKKIPADKGKGFQETQTIELNLKKGEFLSDFYSFRCYAVGPQYAYQKHYAYAVID